MHIVGFECIPVCVCGAPCFYNLFRSDQHGMYKEIWPIETFPSKKVFHTEIDKLTNKCPNPTSPTRLSELKYPTGAWGQDRSPFPPHPQVYTPPGLYFFFY